MADFDCHSLYSLKMASDPRLLQHVVPQRLLDQLQHRRSPELDSQGCDHRSGIDFWSADMVAVHHSTDHQHDTDLGQ